MLGMDNRGRHRGLSPEGMITAQVLGLAPQLVPPRDADAAWSWVNQGGASTTQLQPNGVYMTAPATAGDSWRLRTQSQPTTPYTLKAAVAPLLFPSATGGETPAIAVGWRESGTSELLLARLYFDPTNGALFFDVSRWTNETTFSAAVGGVQHASILCAGPAVMFWLVNDGSTLSVEYSTDGVKSQLLYSESVGTFLTPNQVCWGLNADSATYSTAGVLLSWDRG